MNDPHCNLEAWRYAWRYGFTPQFRTGSLHQLAEALRAGSATLIQGATMDPPFLQSCTDRRPACCCPVGFLVMAEGAETAREVEEEFARACFEADRRLGEPAACRRFLNWLDDGPRDVVFAELLAEVEVELIARGMAMSEAGQEKPDRRVIDLEPVEDDSEVDAFQGGTGRIKGHLRCE